MIGFVHEKDKNDPIVGRHRRPTAIAPTCPRWRPGPTASSATTCRRARTRYDIKADGYRAGTLRRERARPRAASVAIDCPLEALPRVGIVVGHVRDARHEPADRGIQVVLTDSQHKDLHAEHRRVGRLPFEGVAPGTAELKVEADGYLVLVSRPT